MSAKVLYVDDDRSNLIVFEATFQQELDVLTCGSGAEAERLLEAHADVAVLLTDERMPGMTGTELAARVARDRPHVIRMLVTAYADLGTAVDAINRGQVHQYIRKPWDAAEMRAHLRDAIDLFENRRRVRELERRMVEVERVHALGVIAASIVHELRNPMGVIAGYLDLARTLTERLAALVGADGAPVVADLDDALGGAWDSTMRLGEIVRGVELSTRRRDADARADLGDVLALTLKLVANDLIHRGRAEVDVPSGLHVPVSPTRLGQVLLNLVVNGVHAMPRTRPVAANLLAITAGRRGSRVRCEIADNGDGVPDALKDRIFDPFFTTKADGGTGLGLAISRQIVGEVGGTLTVADTPGGGATFVLELPAAT
ncbi:MAG: response regulator [Kofleriaceae bacterium]|nr:response regulator [Myxococcales bacterium]MCB9564830.1 response regulator [Kofleriaceae bacterium]MCB9574168.1 response regulator [Kofleriaceae bacterium]